jgi:DNA/RNA-binding domain of Phe-tRNA-synthetase-like protein
MMSTEHPQPATQPELGWSAQEIAEEFPELHVLAVEVPVQLQVRSSPSVHERLAELSNRWSGPRAMNLRREAVPAAYRIFFRHIGLDPDVTRTPIEAAIFERLMDGGFLPSGHLADILLLALIETTVPVWALDADTVDGPLGIRLSRSEPLGVTPDAPALTAGKLVVADAQTALAILFDEVAPGHRAHAGTQRLILFTIQVAGVSTMHVEEALWIATSALLPG